MPTRRIQLRHLDFLLLASVLIICMGGILCIRGAKHDDLHALDFVRKQSVGVMIGFGILLALALSEYEMLLRRVSPYLYAFNVVLLATVLVVGNSSHGAQRWIQLGPFTFQPSEFAKLMLICTLASYLDKNVEHIKEWPVVIKSFLHVAVPVLLIAKQPDLGTALVLLAIWFGMTAVAGARPTHLLCFVLAGTLLFAGMWHFNKGLKQYQKTRLQIFLNPDADPGNTGYHLRQSVIAIGSGGISGEGYGKGTQSNGKFIPEQHTDFIFTIVGEEGGFVTCIVLLGLYLFVLQRGVAIMADCHERLGRLVAAGVITMLTFHIVVNVGMTMGVMPVVGVPLPYFSYGLSSLFVNMAAVGLLLSVAAHKHRVMF
jgi:rod shape determining protein RodA